MAKGRMLNRTIATDARFNSLLMKEQWLFMRLLPFADDEGKLTGNITELKLLCIPASSISDNSILRLIDAICEAKLMRFQENVGLQYTGWKKNQKIGHRPANSMISDIDNHKIDINKPLISRSKSKFSSINKITSKEIDNLQKQFPNIDVSKVFEQFKDYIDSSGRKYKNYLAALRNQCRMDWAPKLDKTKKKSKMVCPNCEYEEETANNILKLCPVCSKESLMVRTHPEFKRLQRSYYAATN